MTRTAMGVLSVAAWVAVLAPGTGLHLDQYLISWGLLLASTLLGAWPERGRRGEIAFVLGGLIYLAAVGFLRDAAGGFVSGVDVLALVPIVDACLFAHRRHHLAVVLVGTVLLLLIPLVFIGPPAYPHVQYRAAGLLIAVSAIVGVATQELVGDARREAIAARDAHSLLEEVNRVAHDLFESDDVRADLSRAAQMISGASIGALFEPSHRLGWMHSTAVAGAEGLQIDVPLAPGNPIGAVYLEGRRRLIDRATSGNVASARLWERCGSPGSLLYQPLVRGGETIGVLVVGWSEPSALGGSRAAIIDLLAHEAALVLDRADQVTALADMAQTDPLTGLPNRRAWDSRAELSLRDDEPLAVAMLDLDHFKRFNDTYGHLAGDRLLRDTAAAWRETLRPGDLLARLGGEEFGLLLVGRDAAAAYEITERLRESVTDGQTCSAGVAVRRPGELFEAVVGRADHALYDAKAGGRDHVRAAA
jgi:diguanylate cyclase (GGDEF)-like protein